MTPPLRAVQTRDSSHTIMEARAARLADDILREVDALLVSYAASLLNGVATARRVSAHHLAVAVPGVCHEHGPDDRARVPGCAYCKRRGNCLHPSA